MRFTNTDRIERKLRNYNAERMASRALSDVAPEAKSTSRRHANVRTGHMKRNINVDVSRGKLVLGDTNNRAPYMKYQNARRKFLQRGLGSIRDDLRGALRDSNRRELS